MTWEELTWSRERPPEAGELKWRMVRVPILCDEQRFWDFCVGLNRFMQGFVTSESSEYDFLIEDWADA